MLFLPHMFSQWTFIFSLSSPFTAASCFNFCPLALTVWFLPWYVFSFGKSLFMRHLRIILLFATITIAPLISESLLRNSAVTMAILQKCLATFSSKTRAISLTFTLGKYIFNFDACCVSRKFATYLYLNIDQVLVFLKFLFVSFYTLSQWHIMDFINQTGYSLIIYQYNNFILTNKPAETHRMSASYTSSLHQSCLFQPAHISTYYVAKDRTYWTVRSLTAKCFT